jgi:hypothetical protein
MKNPSRASNRSLPTVSHLIASLQHVERLVLALVDMRRGTGPFGCRHLHQAEHAAGLGA